MTITLTPARRACTPADAPSREQVTGPYRDPMDEPCKPGQVIRWPGGPAWPRWVEQEHGLCSTARTDALPPTREQLTVLRDEYKRTQVPTTRADARALILASMDGETDERWWE